MLRLISLLALGATAVSAEKKLCAKFDFEGLEATVVVKQSESDCALNVAKWEVEFTQFNDDLCPGGVLNWHVHQYAGSGIVDTDGHSPGCHMVTGGHYDPTFACGVKSQNVGNGVCEVLRSTYQTPDGNGVALGPYMCSTDDQTGCEIGDLVGKMGKLTATVPSPAERRLKKGKSSKSKPPASIKQKFDDNWITPIANIENRSIMLHCCNDDGCSSKLACATLEAV